METNDTNLQIPLGGAAQQPPTVRRYNWPSLFFLAASLTAGSAAVVVYSLSGADPKPKETPNGVAWSWDEVFPNWPKDQKPEFVIILTGQTHGYLQKCGCSDPQRGGLERRFNFFQGFKAHNIEVIPLDLGGMAPEISQEHRLLHQQALLKYKTAMNAMKTMDYRKVGLGKEEFEIGLLEALGEFGMQPGNEQPGMLAANLTGYMAGRQELPKRLSFPNAAGNDTAIADWSVIPTKGKLTLGVVGIVGDPIIHEVKKLDEKIVFAPNSAKVLNEALTAFGKQKNKPNLNVLLYSGPLGLAQKAADAFPDFGIVVCNSEESEPPAKPTLRKHAPNKDGKTPPDSMIIQLGHKGQNVGVVGVFRNKQGGFDLQYQLVSMSPKFETPDDPMAIASNGALKELERYSQTVKNRNFLAMNRKGPHPLQVANKNAQYVGSQACAWLVTIRPCPATPGRPIQSPSMPTLTRLWLARRGRRFDNSTASAFAAIPLATITTRASWTRQRRLSWKMSVVKAATDRAASTSPPPRTRR